MKSVQEVVKQGERWWWWWWGAWGNGENIWKFKSTH
jgi:hypothetical protein